MSNLPPPPPPSGGPPPPPPGDDLGTPAPPPSAPGEALTIPPPPPSAFAPPPAPAGYAPPLGGYGGPGGLSAQPGVPPGYQQKEKMVAGLLGILIGSFGVHSFYLGNTTKGIIQIVVTVLTCGLGGLWGLIEGIMILTGSINTDANGVPLKA